MKLLTIIILSMAFSCTKTKYVHDTLIQTKDSLVVKDSIRIITTYSPDVIVDSGSQYDLLSGEKYKFTFTAADSLHSKWTIVAHVDSIVYNPGFVSWGPEYHYLLFFVNSSYMDSIGLVIGYVDLATGTQVYDHTWVTTRGIDPYSLHIQRSTYYYQF
jgi:hypothetical protein